MIKTPLMPLMKENKRTTLNRKMADCPDIAGRRARKISPLVTPPMPKPPPVPSILSCVAGSNGHLLADQVRIRLTEDRRSEE